MLQRRDTDLATTDVSGSAMALQRTSGSARVRFRADAGKMRLSEFYQAGALRLRLPHADPPEVVVVNTAGGLTGGDRLDLEVVMGERTSASLTTAACEKVYRSVGGDAGVTATLRLDAESRLDWLPQPLILFDGARVRRTLAVDMQADATLLAVEGLIFGRTAMGEDLIAGTVHDGWRVRRAGRLVYADAFRVGPEVRSRVNGAATLRGMRASASLLYVAPDAEQRLAAARLLLEACAGEAGASAWDGVLLVRFAGRDGHGLISDLVGFLTAFRGTAMPRSWGC
jgi:urease accessory protein